MKRKITTVLFIVIDKDMSMEGKVFICICVQNVSFEPQNIHFDVYYTVNIDRVNKVAYRLCDTNLFAKYHSVCHVRVHTEHKPIKCNICNKCLWCSNKHDKHFKMQTGEKPCQCNIFDTNIIAISDFKYSQGAHTRDNPY